MYVCKATASEKALIVDINQTLYRDPIQIADLLFSGTHILHLAKRQFVSDPGTVCSQATYLWAML